MATKVTNDSIPLTLYRGNQASAVLSRQNGKFSGSFSIPIKTVGTVLVVLRSDQAFTEAELKTRLEEGSENYTEFLINYYQLLATCNLSSDTLSSDYVGTLSASYKMGVSGASAASDNTELFLANTLSAKAARQSSKPAENIKVDVTDTSGDDYVSLVLLGAKDDEGNPYVFELSEGEDEDTDCDAIKAYLACTTQGQFVVEEVRILGHFPQDQADFASFVDGGYKITVAGKASLALSENTGGEG